MTFPRQDRCPGMEKRGMGMATGEKILPAGTWKVRKNRFGKVGEK